jgi:arrestin-related trafficking adapter 3/6
MRISRLDPDDPAKKRRRHFEISIDSPFTVLNCRATQANMMLPQYSGPDLPGFRQQASCGCPDAEVLATNPSPASSTGTLPLPDHDISTVAMPTAPEAAHLHVPSHISSPANSRPVSMVSPQVASPLQRVLDQEDFQNPRPIHLLRVPSFDPPAFDADNSPPPLPMDIMTPPPNYDVIIGTPSVDGLADYFARREAYEGPGLEGVVEDESDSGEDAAITRITSRTGRVHVANPRTPGGRMPSRSLDIERPLELTMPEAVARNV